MTVYDDALTKLNAASAAVADADTFVQQTPPLVSLGADTVAAMAALEDAQAKLKALQMMPLVCGLLTSQALPRTLPAGLSGAVPMVNWRDLQNVKGGPLQHPNRIDAALALGYPFRVRLNAGIYSPSFVLTAAGTFQDADPYAATVSWHTTPKWWTSAFQTLFADLVDKLAAAYDGAISSIFIAPEMTIYAEPFQRGTSNAQVRQNMVNAGYTWALDEAAHKASFEYFKAFKRTRLAKSFNPFQTIDATGAAAIDSAFTISQMDLFRQTFGERAILQNNSIRTPSLKSYGSMYQHMSGSKPLSFQTATAPRIGDYAQTLQWAVDQGAHAVEIQSGWSLTTTQLLEFDAALKANA